MTRTQREELAKHLDTYNEALRTGAGELADLAYRAYRRVALAAANADPTATAVTMPNGTVIPTDSAEAFRARYNERHRAMMTESPIV